MQRTRVTFGALVAAQAAHSVEEYVGRLWESFPPARFLTGVFFGNREHGFIVLNVALVGFGLWCLLWPVRRGWSSAETLMSIWIVVELINGIGHPLWSIRQGGYTPGAATAPMLLVLATCLAWQLRRATRVGNDDPRDSHAQSSF